MPPKYRGTPTTPTDSESRWATASRLVDDNSIHPADRIAAALVVLYAQPLARVTALTLDHIRTDGQAIMLRLGEDELELPEPFASLIVQLPCPLRDGPSMQFPVDGCSRNTSGSPDRADSARESTSRPRHSAPPDAGISPASTGHRAAARHRRQRARTSTIDGRQMGRGSGRQLDELRPRPPNLIPPGYTGKSRRS